MSIENSHMAKYGNADRVPFCSGSVTRRKKLIKRKYCAGILSTEIEEAGNCMRPRCATYFFDWKAQHLLHVRGQLGHQGFVAVILTHVRK